MSCDEKTISLIGSKREYNARAFKKPKIGLLVLTLVLCITAAVACSADKPEQECAVAEQTSAPTSEPSVSADEAMPQDEDITGVYAFEENIVTNPLSSFMAVKGDMPYYVITDEGLNIVDEENDTVEEFEGKPALSTISKEDFNALFEDEIVLEGDEPYIEAYSQCMQYAIYKDKYVEYRIYRMDDEVWLAKFSNGHIWSIYRLVITDETTIGIVGGADGPTAVYVN